MHTTLVFLLLWTNISSKVKKKFHFTNLFSLSFGFPSLTIINQLILLYEEYVNLLIRIFTFYLKHIYIHITIVMIKLYTLINIEQLLLPLIGK